MKKKGKKPTKTKADMGACCGGKTDCSGGCGYFLGFIGAAVYYISTAGGFWAGVLGLLKALVWPAFLVYEVLKFVA